MSHRQSYCQSVEMDTHASTVSGANPSPDSSTEPSRSESDDRLRELLSALNLPALPTGGSRVRLIAIGHRASGIGHGADQSAASLRRGSANVDSGAAHS